MCVVWLMRDVIELAWCSRTTGIIACRRLYYLGFRCMPFELSKNGGTWGDHVFVVLLKRNQLLSLTPCMVMTHHSDIGVSFFIVEFRSTAARNACL